MVGIYRIYCTKTKKSYIGQSIEIEKRWQKHVFNLGMNQHHSPELQADWNKYGIEAFIFEVLYECEEQFLNAMENYYIELYSAIISGYNTRSNRFLCKPKDHGSRNAHKQQMIKRVKEISRLYDRLLICHSVKDISGIYAESLYDIRMAFKKLGCRLNPDTLELTVYNCNGETNYLLQGVGFKGEYVVKKGV